MPAGTGSVKQLFLVALLSLTLVGMQALQESPWHDHSHHVVDCALCHLQFYDAAVPSTERGFEQSARHAVLHSTFEDSIFSRTTSPYQGRAPPFLS